MRVRGPGAFGADDGVGPGWIDAGGVRVALDLAAAREREAQVVLVQILALVQPIHGAVVPALRGRGGGGDAALRRIELRVGEIPFAPRLAQAAEREPFERARQARVVRRLRRRSRSRRRTDRVRLLE